jgi:hypothetical protein
MIKLLPLPAGWKILLLLMLFSPVARVTAQENAAPANQQPHIFSAIKGASSRPDTIVVSLKKEGSKVAATITGEDATRFRLIAGPSQQTSAKTATMVVAFTPADDFTGIAHAVLQVKDASGKQLAGLGLTGLSTKGLEGENEAPLEDITKALGYQVKVGWSGLAHTESPELQGEEIEAGLFRKAGRGRVEMLPVARYSPDFQLPFGYFTNGPGGPLLHQAGILKKTTGAWPEHQTLFPHIAEGGSSFDPGEAVFGLYSTGPTHTAYSLDDWNLLLFPANAGHATRTYPVKDKQGKQLPNTFLVCFEEAKNGDYNDYVFLVKNVQPLTGRQAFKPLLDGRDLEGWDIFLKDKGINKDTEHNFSVENGAVHVRGKELGYIRTKDSFTNYHFKVEFKWGEKKWPPREKDKRDAGICYNIPVSEPDSIWPKSIECQVQEGDVGDFWLLSFATIEVDGRPNQPSEHTRIVKKKDAEKPNGEWNSMEIISCNGKCIHIVNGVVVNAGENASVKSGRILLQSEYSEVYYRNAMIREIK